MAQNPRPTPIHRREIVGGASVVVPFDEVGDPDWASFARHISRVAKVGLTPAVSMTMGDSLLLRTDLQVGAIYQAEEALAGGSFYAGVHVLDDAGDWFNMDRYRRQAEVVVNHGGIPVIFPSHGLTALPDDEWLKVMSEMGRDLNQFLVGDVDANRPSATLRSTDAYVGLLRNPHCIGIAHHSLTRASVWDRLQAHVALRPDFRLISLNERAIDLAIYGSDYVLFGAGMAPELFARRDALWADGDRDFYDLNSALQYLCNFTSRMPESGQAHSVLQFMELRNWVTNSRMPVGAVSRPDADVAVLSEIARRLGVL